MSEPTPSCQPLRCSAPCPEGAGFVSTQAEGNWGMENPQGPEKQRSWDTPGQAVTEEGTSSLPLPAWLLHGALIHAPLQTCGAGDTEIAWPAVVKDWHCCSIAGPFFPLSEHILFFFQIISPPHKHVWRPYYTPNPLVGSKDATIKDSRGIRSDPNRQETVYLPSPLLQGHKSL